MRSDGVENWLQDKRRKGILSSAFYAVATIIGGAIFLGLTFWVVFMAAKLILLSAYPLGRFVVSGSVLIAVVICGLIFADSLHAMRDDMSFLPTWLLREYIDIGPRLILEGYPHLARARTWWRLDLENDAKVLRFLAVRDLPTQKQDLLRIFPGLDWNRLIVELKLIPGVIFFQPQAARVTLTLPLRLELRQLIKQPRRVRLPKSEPEPAPEPEATPINEPQKLSPAEILGVTSAATTAEIKLAYRRRIKECHPDRFAGMDERSRELAEEWTKSLNAAYETLMAEKRTGA